MTFEQSDVSASSTFNATAESVRPIIADCDQDIVLLDFDGTMTNRDSFLAFLWLLWLQDRSLFKALKAVWFFVAAFVGVIGKQQAKEHLISLFALNLTQAQIELRCASLIAGLIQDSDGMQPAHTHRDDSSLAPSPTQLPSRAREENFVVSFISRLIQPTIRRYFRELIRAALSEHKRVIIVSASPDIYLAPVASALGVELICSRLEFNSEGRFTGHFLGANCNGLQKVAAVQEYLAKTSLSYDPAPAPKNSKAHIEVYGNSSNDWPMLELASSNADAHYNDFVPASPARQLRLILQMLRVPQYIKNLFVFIPIFFAGQIFELDVLLQALSCFVAFCCISSFIYILNDWQDRESDRNHPYKRFRPLAYGAVSSHTALISACLLLLLSVGISASLTWQTCGLVCSYLLLNLAYVYYLKNIALFDLCCVALGFNLRVFAGASACGISVSAWLVLMVFLLSMFLVAGKRWDDLGRSQLQHHNIRRSLYGYNKDFALSTLTFLSAINTVCYILYTMDTAVMERLHSHYVYITALWVVLGNLRYLQNIFVFKQGFSPTKILLHDRALALCLVGWLLSMGVILYV